MRTDVRRFGFEHSPASAAAIGNAGGQGEASPGEAQGENAVRLPNGAPCEDRPVRWILAPLVLFGCRFDFERAPGATGPDGDVYDGAFADAIPGLDAGPGDGGVLGWSAGCGDGVCTPGELAASCPIDCCPNDCRSNPLCDCCLDTSSNAACVRDVTGPACACAHDCSMVTGSCNSTCSGNTTCWTDCGAAGRCVLGCDWGSTCLMDCRTGTGDCELTCDDAECVLYCREGDPLCRFVVCSGGTRAVADCGGGVFVCNETGDCP